jgi:hypothetical protein
MLRQDLGHQKDIPAPATDSFADQLFGFAIPIHFSGIDQFHAEIETELKCPNLLVPAMSSFCQVPSTLPENGHWLARRKLSSADCGRCLHGMVLRA